MAEIDTLLVRMKYACLSKSENIVVVFFVFSPTPLSPEQTREAAAKLPDPVTGSQENTDRRRNRTVMSITPRPHSND